MMLMLSAGMLLPVLSLKNKAQYKREAQ